MTIGNRIKNLRIQVGLSQSKVAEMIGTIKQTIYKYETGIITNIPSDKIEQLARIFKVSPSYIMGWEDEEQKSNNIAISTHFKISPHEKELVVAYREHPESQLVIDKILDIDKPKTVKVYTAARSKDGKTKAEYKEITEEEANKIFNSPPTDESF